jgi:hypothetical protein
VVTHHFQEEGQFSTYTLIAKYDLNFSTTNDQFPKSQQKANLVRSADAMLPVQVITRKTAQDHGQDE